ncbi:MAG: hypothetical protein JWO12_938, partial [Frankiales bacterium]|nr:hypothetical protein [Frankiales bacterium]
MRPAPTGRASTPAIGHLAAAAQRFALSTGRSPALRRSMGNNVLVPVTGSTGAQVSAPRWWRPTHDLVHLSGPDQGPPSPPPRGLKRSVQAGALRERPSGRTLPGLTPVQVPVRRTAEVTAAGPMLSSHERPASPGQPPGGGARRSTTQAVEDAPSRTHVAESPAPSARAPQPRPELPRPGLVGLPARQVTSTLARRRAAVQLAKPSPMPPPMPPPNRGAAAPLTTRLGTPALPVAVSPSRATAVAQPSADASQGGPTRRSVPAPTPERTAGLPLRRQDTASVPVPPATERARDAQAPGPLPSSTSSSPSMSPQPQPSSSAAPHGVAPGPAAGSASTPGSAPASGPLVVSPDLAVSAAALPRVLRSLSTQVGADDTADEAVHGHADLMPAAGSGPHRGRALRRSLALRVPVRGHRLSSPAAPADRARPAVRRLPSSPGSRAHSLPASPSPSTATSPAESAGRPVAAPVSAAATTRPEALAKHAARGPSEAATPSSAPRTDQPGVRRTRQMPYAVESLLPTRRSAASRAPFDAPVDAPWAVHRSLRRSLLPMAAGAAATAPLLGASPARPLSVVRTPAGLAPAAASQQGQPTSSPAWREAPAAAAVHVLRSTAPAQVTGAQRAPARLDLPRAEATARGRTSVNPTALTRGSLVGPAPSAVTALGLRRSLRPVVDAGAPPSPAAFGGRSGSVAVAFRGQAHGVTSPGLARGSATVATTASGLGVRRALATSSAAAARPAARAAAGRSRSWSAADAAPPGVGRPVMDRSGVNRPGGDRGVSPVRSAVSPKALLRQANATVAPPRGAGRAVEVAAPALPSLTGTADLVLRRSRGTDAAAPPAGADMPPGAVAAFQA